MGTANDLAPWGALALAAVAAVAWRALGMVLDRRLRRANRVVGQALVRLDEARRYVERDRAAERRERDRLIRQRAAARERLVELEQLLRSYLVAQSIIDAAAAVDAAAAARESLASDFGELTQ